MLLGIEKTYQVYEEPFGKKKGPTKLFQELGQNVFLETPIVSSFSKENECGLLRMSFWYSKSLCKLQKGNGRYGVTFNVDQLHLLNENLEEIEQALSLTEQERFLEYVLPLGKKWYVTVQNGDSTLSFRCWWCFEGALKDLTTELMPLHDGI